MRPDEQRVRRGEICVECFKELGGAVGHTRLCRTCRDEHDRGDDDRWPPDRGDGCGRPLRRPRPKPLVSG
jgi:hypothetical protein